MTRGTMRSILARRIGDPNQVHFSEAEYDETLNTAAGIVQATIMVLEPLAFLSVSRSNLVESLNGVYPKPQGCWSLLDLRMLTSEGVYRSLGKPVDHVTLDTIPSGSAVSRFAHFGRRVKIAPAPEDVTDGLEWYFVEEMSIPTGTANDGDSFPLHTGVHELVVLRAELILAPDFAADADLTVLLGLIKDAEQRLPLYYRRSVGEEMGWQPQLVKAGQP